MIDVFKPLRLYAQHIRALGGAILLAGCVIFLVMVKTSNPGLRHIALAVAFTGFAIYYVGRFGLMLRNREERRLERAATDDSGE